MTETVLFFRELHGNLLKTINFNTFSNMPKLLHLDLHNNEISSLPSRSFENLPMLMELRLHSQRHKMTTIMHDAFVEIGGNLSFVSDNALTSYPHPVLETGWYPQLWEILWNGSLLVLTDEYLDSEKETFSSGVHNLSKSYPSSVIITIIERNAIQYIPEAVRNNDGALALTELSLEGNQITFIQKGAFSNLTTLKHMYGFQTMFKRGKLRACSVSRLVIRTSHIKDCVLVIERDLEGMGIIAIENGAFNDGIDDIDLADNKFRFTHEYPFANLRKLQKLDLENNKIDYLPPFAFGNCTSLEELDLHQNQILQILKSHFANSQLSDGIYLHNNDIGYIEDGTFSHINTIQVIDISNNKLARLPTGGDFVNTYLGGVQSNAFTDILANKLDLNENQIRRIETRAFQEVLLETDVFLIGTKLTKLPNKMMYMVTAKNLYMSDGLIENIAMETFYDVHFTSLMDLSRNKLKHQRVPMFGGRSKVTGLILANNRLISLSSDVFDNVVLFAIDLSFNSLNAYPRSLVSQTNLTKIELQGNRITDLEDDSFWNLNNLTHLDVSCNALKLIRSNLFKNTSTLFYLNLQKNDISTIDPKAFPSMLTIQHFQLQNNSISHFPRISVQHIHILNLTYNFIETFHVNAFDDIGSLALTGNPLGCQCETVTTLHKLALQNVIIQGECRFPPAARRTLYKALSIASTYIFTTSIGTAFPNTSITSNVTFNTSGLEGHEYECSVQMRFGNYTSARSSPVYVTVPILPDYLKTRLPNTRPADYLKTRLSNTRLADYLKTWLPNTRLADYLKTWLPNTRLADYLKTWLPNTRLADYLKTWLPNTRLADYFKTWLPNTRLADYLKTWLPNTRLADYLKTWLPNTRLADYLKTRFWSGEYYPVDGQGFNHEQQYDCNMHFHNFGFTTALRTALNFSGEEAFTIGGGEALWLFVNKIKVVDYVASNESTPMTCFLVDLSSVLGNRQINVLQGQLTSDGNCTGFSNITLMLDIDLKHLSSPSPNTCRLWPSTCRLRRLAPVVSRLAPVVSRLAPVVSRLAPVVSVIGEIYHFDFFHAEAYPCTSELLFMAENANFVNDPVISAPMDYEFSVSEFASVNTFVGSVDIGDLFEVGPYNTTIHFGIGGRHIDFRNNLSSHHETSEEIITLLKFTSLEDADGNNISFIVCDDVSSTLLNLTNTTSNLLTQTYRFRTAKLFLTLHDTLDFEQKSEHNILITIIDESSGRSGLISIRIYVLDENDNCPVISPEVASITPFPILREEPISYFTTSDADSGENGNIYYTISKITPNPPVDYDNTRDLWDDIYQNFTTLQFKVIALDNGTVQRGDIADVNIFISNTCVMDVQFGNIEYTLTVNNYTGGMTLRIPKYYVLDFKCSEPVGISSGEVLDYMMSASSSYHPVYTAAFLARVNRTRNVESQSSGGWVAGKNDTDQYLAVDMGRSFRFTRVHVQGREDANEWVTSFKIYYFIENTNTWKEYTNKNGHNIFLGTTGRDIIRTETLDPVIESKSIRVNPLTWIGNNISLRLELSGCSKDEQLFCNPPRVSLSYPPSDPDVSASLTSWSCGSVDWSLLCSPSLLSFPRAQPPRDDVSCVRCDATNYCEGEGIQKPCGRCDPYDPSSTCGRNPVEHSFGHQSECTPCPNGWIYCIVEICKDGYASICPEFMYAECNATWCPDVCSQCEPGYACYDGRRTQCTPGYWSDGYMGKSTCTLLAPLIGKVAFKLKLFINLNTLKIGFSKSDGIVFLYSAHCEACGPGFYNDKAGSSTCHPCPPGFYSNRASSDCFLCLESEYALGNATGCKKCKDTMECPCMKHDKCFNGKGCYNSKHGGYGCLPCPDGYKSAGESCKDIDEVRYTRFLQSLLDSCSVYSVPAVSTPFLCRISFAGYTRFLQSLLDSCSVYSVPAVSTPFLQCLLRSFAGLTRFLQCLLCSCSVYSVHAVSLRFLQCLLCSCSVDSVHAVFTRFLQCFLVFFALSTRFLQCLLGFTRFLLSLLGSCSVYSVPAVSTPFLQCLLRSFAGLTRFLQCLLCSCSVYSVHAVPLRFLQCLLCSCSVDSLHAVFTRFLQCLLGPCSVYLVPAVSTRFMQCLLGSCSVYSVSAVSSRFLQCLLCPCSVYSVPAVSTLFLQYSFGSCSVYSVHLHCQLGFTRFLQSLLGSCSVYSVPAVSTPFLQCLLRSFAGLTRFLQCLLCSCSVYSVHAVPLRFLQCLLCSCSVDPVYAVFTRFLQCLLGPCSVYLVPAVSTRFMQCLLGSCSVYSVSAVSSRFLQCLLCPCSVYSVPAVSTLFLQYLFGSCSVYSCYENNPCFNSRCINTVPGFQCLECPLGFTGTYEDAYAWDFHQRVFTLQNAVYANVTKQTCGDVNECAISKGRCRENQHCVNTVVILYLLPYNIEFA
ncbi:TOLL6-like protein [Mya arenaria]|uniref:TOLL6-like protein n=1 Tax=Mya arenaria TaxID=6604 RepID=A0ABY7E3S9_MYAAR|nr:TOLL6-like protein [Mya arenaria]